MKFTSYVILFFSQVMEKNHEESMEESLDVIFGDFLQEFSNPRRNYYKHPLMDSLKKLLDNFTKNLKEKSLVKSLEE